MGGSHGQPGLAEQRLASQMLPEKTGRLLRVVVPFVTIFWEYEVELGLEVPLELELVVLILELKSYDGISGKIRATTYEVYEVINSFNATQLMYSS